MFDQHAQSWRRATQLNHLRTVPSTALRDTQYESLAGGLLNRDFTRVGEYLSSLRAGSVGKAVAPAACSWRCNYRSLRRRQRGGFMTPSGLKGSGFRKAICRYWRQALGRRSQRNRLQWSRFGLLTDHYIPSPKNAHKAGAVCGSSARTDLCAGGDR